MSSVLEECPDCQGESPWCPRCRGTGRIEADIAPKPAVVCPECRRWVYHLKGCTVGAAEQAASERS